MIEPDRVTQSVVNAWNGMFSASSDFVHDGPNDPPGKQTVVVSASRRKSILETLIPFPPT